MRGQLDVTRRHEATQHENACRRNYCIAPGTLDVDAVCRWVVSFNAWPLYHRWKSPFLATVPPVAELHYSLDTLLCKPYGSFGHSEEDENVCMSQESNVKSPLVLPRSPVTVRTDPCVNER